MSTARSCDGKKEAQVEGGGSYLEDGQCDSGIGSIRSLHGQLGEGEPRSLAARGAPDPSCIGKEGAADADERLDSSYGSSSFVESLAGLEGEGSTPASEEQEAEGEEEERLRQVLGSSSFLCEDGDTLLHLAIIHCVPSIALNFIAILPVELLEIQNNLFQTPLHLSVYLEQSRVVQALVLKGVNTALQDRNGNTPLHLACEQQNLECVQLLLLQDPIFNKHLETRKNLQDLQLQNWQGLSCLHISTMKGNLQLMALLVKTGANINVQDGTSGKTPLHLAVENHDEMAVKHLLRMGAQVDAQMYNGCTPLHLAVGRKDAAIAAILCHSGADTLLRNMEDETAQDLADDDDDILTLLPFDDLKISGKPVVCSS
ncbi:NF-kappa-B inhibitor epsilon [Varanus komodoensis]|uniref:NFKB inhibitor epsilon n=1 Tax=Varanus komodoensis TaxID=61221 RepID=A0A8D2ITV6_VARKO|nr:NF-kappa-B inhibitor epsilon [Varanus komodoensis]KAF7254739.1 NF-kappa-B inhibitor epsilon [Varanus komodoensis]